VCLCVCERERENLCVCEIKSEFVACLRVVFLSQDGLETTMTSVILRLLDFKRKKDSAQFHQQSYLHFLP